MIDGDFADYLRHLNTRGSDVRPVRLNEAMRCMLKALMQESLENTSVDFPEPEDEDMYDEFMQSMMFIEQLLEPGANRRVKIPKHIAKTLYYWIRKHKYHHLSHEPCFDASLQWLMNFVSKQYAVSEFVRE